MLQILAIFALTVSVKQVSTQTTYSCSPSAPCGCSANAAVLSRIVGGETASGQTWGWAASLRYSATNAHFCGGSIISDSHILTAAHCTKNLQTVGAVTVFVGSIYLGSSGQQRSVSYIHIHPSYSSSTYVNDISILKLSSPLDLTQNVLDLICLPNVSSTVLASGEYPAANTNLVAIGWGVTVQGSETVSTVLRQVTVQSIAASSSYCQHAGLSDASDQLCAGVMPNGGKDTCQGDSGGPLMMFRSDNVWEQIGITSNGYGCAQPGYPGIYTRVAAYQTWINDTMNSAHSSFCLSSMITIPFLLLFFF